MINELPLYIPDWKLWHVEQALRSLLGASEHAGMHVEELVSSSMRQVDGSSDSDVNEVIARLKSSGVLVVDKRLIARGWEFVR